MYNFFELFQLSMTHAPIYATPRCIHGPPPGQAQPVVPGPAEPPRRAERGAGAAGRERRRDGGGGAEEEEGTTAGGTQEWFDRDFQFLD